MKPMEQWHRRHALALANMLPDDIDDARQLVETFVRPEVAEPLPDNVRPLRGGQG